MQGRTAIGDIVPINLEIEATCRRNNTARRRREQEAHGSSHILPLPSPAHIQRDEEPTRGVTLEDFSSTTTPQFFTSIARPEVQAANISYPHFLIQLIQGNLFHGLPNEDPYAHLATYIDICNTVKITEVPEDAIRLNLFCFSLAESKTAEGKMEISSSYTDGDWVGRGALEADAEALVRVRRGPGKVIDGSAGFQQFFFT
ncbi:hypothetical protein GmHk_06G017543 [Glycine max]|nr:hypothetical protein GmHk_06G017543 [Glycine max]